MGQAQPIRITPQIKEVQQSNDNSSKQGATGKPALGRKQRSSDQKHAQVASQVESQQMQSAAAKPSPFRRNDSQELHAE